MVAELADEILRLHSNVVDFKAGHVTRDWINLRCVRLFIREGREIPEKSDSHIIIARVLDSQDPLGLCIELNRGKHEENSSVELQGMMIPWDAVLSVVVRENVSPELWKEAEKMGFVSGESGNVEPT